MVDWRMTTFTFLFNSFSGVIPGYDEYPKIHFQELSEEDVLQARNLPSLPTNHITEWQDKCLQVHIQYAML